MYLLQAFVRVWLNFPFMLQVSYSPTPFEVRFHSIHRPREERHSFFLVICREKMEMEKWWRRRKSCVYSLLYIEEFVTNGLPLLLLFVAVFTVLPFSYELSFGNIVRVFLSKKLRKRVGGNDSYLWTSLGISLSFISLFWLFLMISKF